MLLIYLDISVTKTVCVCVCGYKRCSMMLDRLFETLSLSLTHSHTLILQSLFCCSSQSNPFLLIFSFVHISIFICSYKKIFAFISSFFIIILNNNNNNDKIQIVTGSIILLLKLIIIKFLIQQIHLLFKIYAHARACFCL